MCGESLHRPLPGAGSGPRKFCPEIYYTIPTLLGDDCLSNRSGFYPLDYNYLDWDLVLNEKQRISLGYASHQEYDKTKFPQTIRYFGNYRNTREFTLSIRDLPIILWSDTQEVTQPPKETSSLPASLALASASPCPVITGIFQWTVIKRLDHKAET